MASDLVWNSPETLSAEMVDASEPQIVMDASGNITVAWVEGGFVMANYLPFQGSWSMAQVLSASGSSSPRLAVAGNGDVTAVWLEGDVVKTATAASGTWGAVTSLSSSGASSPLIAANAGGDLVSLWVRAGFIEAKSKLVAGSWSLVSTLSGANSDHPDLAVGGDGTVIAVWHTIETGFSICKSSSLSAIGASWTTPKNIVQITPAYAFDYPKVAVDANGNAAGLAFRYQVVNGAYINVVIYGSELPKNAPAWKALPTALSGPGIRNPADLFSKISFDANGNAMAMWTMSYDSSSFAVETSMKYLGGDWFPKLQLVEPALYSFGADIDGNSLGGVVGAYMFYDGSDLTLQSVESNISGVNQEIIWTSPVQFSTNAENAYPKVATVFLDPEVLVAAAWLGYDGANRVLQVATGSRQTIDPPSNLSVDQSVIDFGVYSDYYNTISWDASPAMNVSQYLVFRNGVLFATTSNMTFEAVEHNAGELQPVTYGVAAQDNLGNQSPIVYVNFP